MKKPLALGALLGGSRVWDHQIGSLEVEWDDAGHVLPLETSRSVFRERRRRDRRQAGASAHNFANLSQIIELD